MKRSWIWALLGGLAFMGITAAAGGNGIPSIPGRPPNLIMLSSNLDLDDLADGTVLSDAVSLATFPSTIAVSGYGFRANPELMEQAYLLMVEVARANPAITFLLYQNLRMTSHGEDEVAVMSGQFGKRAFADAILPAEDLEGFRYALEDAAARLS